MRRGLVAVLVVSAVAMCASPASGQVPSGLVQGVEALTFGEVEMVPGIGLEVPLPAVGEACPDDPDRQPEGTSPYARKCAVGPVVCTAYNEGPYYDVRGGDACTLTAGDVTLSCANQHAFRTGSHARSRDCALSAAGTTVSLHCETGGHGGHGSSGAGSACAVWPVEASESHYGGIASHHELRMRLGGVRYTCVSEDATYDLQTECEATIS